MWLVRFFLVGISLVACGGATARSGDDESVELGAGGTSDPRCLPQGGYADDACDTCENSFCCEERFDCYDDRSCGTAADVLDGCIDRAQSDTGATARCWSAFAANGPHAQARFSCARAHCAAACEVPN
jgi:hypothetical protein